jgi:hypothetical protein
MLKCHTKEFQIKVCKNIGVWILFFLFIFVKADFISFFLHSSVDLIGFQLSILATANQS